MPPRRPVGFHRGSMPRGEATRQMASSERRGRELLSQLVDHGLLRSETPKGEVFLHFYRIGASPVGIYAD